jgi:hypothetical protein
LPIVAPSGKYSVWSAEGLPSMFGPVGQCARSLMGGQWPCRLAGGWRQCVGGGLPVLSVYCGMEKSSTG